MTTRQKRVIKWSVAGPVVAVLAFLVSTDGFVMPWQAVTKSELKQHEVKMETRFDALSKDVHLIMGALGVKKP